MRDSFFPGDEPLCDDRARSAQHGKKQQRIEKARAAYAARRQWAEQQGGQLHATGRVGISPSSTDPAVMRWYALELQPLLASVRPADIARALGVSQSYSLSIRRGRVPHARHFAPLAKLAGVPLPKFMPGECSAA